MFKCEESISINAVCPSLEIFNEENFLEYCFDFDKESTLFVDLCDDYYYNYYVN